MPRSTRYRNPETGIEITVSRPAEKLLGPQKVPTLVRALTEVMAALGASGAYVSKRCNTLEISVWSRSGWAGTMKVTP